MFSSHQRCPFGIQSDKKGILPDPFNIAMIFNWPILRTVHEGRGILGLGNYYWHFIQNFNEKMQPLEALIKKDKPFKWTEECKVVFDNIEQALKSPEIMAFTNDDEEFILHTDASG